VNSKNKHDKLWGGRFAEQTDLSAEIFSASIHYDKRLYRFDIQASKAHAKMLCKTGLLSSDEKSKIIKGLNTILSEIESGNFEFRMDREDIHMNIEARLIELIGDAGAKLHTARSRNDQVVTDMRLYMKDEIISIVNLIENLQQSFLKKADENKKLIMPGFTHLQHAQPVLLSHHLLAYIEMLERDKHRLCDAYGRMNVMPLGSCALAGTPLPIDRKAVNDILGFEQISRNSIDAVSDRDFIIEVLSDIAILGTHLSRLGEEIVIWTTPEFSFVSLSDAYCTGSSIMPQKKNPDMAELTRGKTARLIGNLTTVLTLMKGLPLAYNRDLQEDKEPLFDSIDTIKGMLCVCDGMISNISFNEERLKNCAESDFSLATEIADYLVMKKVPFRNAHKIVGSIVSYCIGKNKTFKDLTLAQWQTFSSDIEGDIKKILSVETSIKSKKSAGSTSYAEVKKQIKYWRKIFDNVF